MNTFLLKNTKLYRNGCFTSCDILVEKGIITKIGETIDSNVKTIDCKGNIVAHNFIDIHTHLREPGFEYKETIETGTLSALYGGYGTVVAMANTLPCMDDIQAIKDFEQRVKKDAHVHTYTYSAITEELKGQQVVDIEENVKESIVLGFSDDGKGVQLNDKMNEAMSRVKEVDSIIVAHCEDESELHGGCIHEGKYAKEHDLIGINNASEYKQVARDLDIVRKYHNRYHVCHISTKETVALLKQAKKEGLVVSGEVTPHHLTLTDENIQNCDPNYKMNPPVRSKEDLDALIKGLNDGTLTVISTDHAPHSREEKAKHISKAPFGIIGLQHAFSIINTYCIDKGLIKLETVLDALTIGPAKVLRLDGSVEVGNTAELVVIDLNQSFMITEDIIKSKSINMPFINTEVKGKVIANIVDGIYYNLEEESCQ